MIAFARFLLRHVILTVLLMIVGATAAFATNPPTVQPGPAGCFFQPQFCTMSSSEGGAQIRYTLDGSDPGPTSTLYTSGFNVSTTTTVKAIAIVASVPSDITTSYIEIDTTTTNVPRNMSLWLKSDMGVESSGGSVSIWRDLSDLKSNATQTTGADQPTVQTNQINGHPAINFDGSSQYMNLNSFGISSFSGCTFFIVTKPTTVAAGAPWFEFAPSAGNGKVSLSQPNTTDMTFSVNNSGTPSSLSAANAVTANQYQIVSVTQDSLGTATLYTNDTDLNDGTVDSISSVTRNASRLGKNSAGTLFQGQIAEMLVYPQTLSEAQRLNVQGYLFARYHLGVSPPTITPGKGVFSSNTTVSMTGDPGAVLHYTTDGSTPTAGSPTYAGPFNISSTTTVKAIAVQSFGTSSVSSAFLQFDSTITLVQQAGLRNWYKADNGVITNGAAVTKWLDMSPQNNHAEQRTTGNQPTLTSSAINNLPAITFNGSSSFLKLPASSGLGGVSIFAVVKPTGLTSANARVVEFGQGTSNNLLYVAQPTNTGISLNVSDGTGVTSTLTSANAVALNQAQLVAAIEDNSGNANIYTNGVSGAQGTITAIPFVARKNNYMCTNNANTLFFQGQIAEVLIYQGNVSASDQYKIQSYLYARWALKVNPPLITPDHGVFGTNQSVSMSGDPGAQIRYTLDGSTPDQNSPLYNGSPISVTSTLTLKAIAIQPFGTSDVAAAYLQIDPNSVGVSRTGMEVWLKADNGVDATSSKIGFWRDMSPDGLNSATQTNSSKKPTLVASGLNGLPTVSFNGSSEYMQFLNQLSTSFGPTGATVFLVVKPTAVTANARFLEFGNGPSNNTFYVSQPSNNAASITTSDLSAPGSVTSANAITLNQFQVLQVNHGGNLSAAISTNGNFGAYGSLPKISSVPRNTNLLATDAGTSLNFQGELAELIVYRRNLTSAENAAVRGYLFARYALAVSSPSILPPGSVAQAQTFTLSCPDPGSNIYYTTDGSPPTTSSTHYTTPFLLNTSSVIKAIATQSFATSAVSTGYFEANPNVRTIPRTNMVLWLKSDTGVVRTGQQISAWYDMSPAGNHALQSNSSNQPLFSPTSITGLPEVTFDGTSQHFVMSPSFSDFASGTSIFVAVRPATSNTETLLDLGNGNNVDSITLGKSGTGVTLTQVGASGVFSVGGLNAVTLNTYQAVSALGASGGLIRTNGVLKGSGGLQPGLNVQLRALNHIGTNYNASSSFFQGGLSELIVFNRDLSQTERTDVEAYLMQKYQLFNLATRTPVLSVASGTLSAPTQVSIAADAGATIYLTTDGSTPSTSSTVYTGPLAVTFSQTVKCIAVRNGVQSGIASATYTLDSNQWPAPVAGDPSTLNLNIHLPSTALPQ